MLALGVRAEGADVGGLANENGLARSLGEISAEARGQRCAAATPREARRLPSNPELCVQISKFDAARGEIESLYPIDSPFLTGRLWNLNHAYLYFAFRAFEQLNGLAVAGDQITSSDKLEAERHLYTLRDGTACRISGSLERVEGGWIRPRVAGSCVSRDQIVRVLAPLLPRCE